MPRPFTFAVRLEPAGYVQYFDTFNSSSTFEQIQKAIATTFGFKTVECLLFHKGKILAQDSNLLAEYGIDDGDTIMLHERKRNISEDDLLQSELASNESTLPLAPKPEGFEAVDDDTDSLCGECKSAETHNVKETVRCDECHEWYHWKCLGPPMALLPVEDWYCPACRNDVNAVIRPDNEATKPKTRRKSKKVVGGMANLGLSRRSPLPDNFRGPIPGVVVGQSWMFRKLCAEDGVHRPLISGIHGSQRSGGTVSICMSGGYDTNDDQGDWFLYTGCGGFEEIQSGSTKALARTKQKQVRDQTLLKHNLAMAITCDAPPHKDGAVARNWRESKEIRIVRGYKGKNMYSPKEGFRYDGIYKIVRYYRTEPLESGFTRYIFEFRRDDPNPAPWTDAGRLRIKQLGLKTFKSTQGTNHSGARSSGSQDVSLASHISREISPESSVQWRVPHSILVAIAEAVSVLPSHERVFGPILAENFQGSYQFTRFLYDNLTCGICMAFVDHPVTNVCGHITCHKCITHWVKTRCICPVCKSPLLASTRHGGYGDSEFAKSLERQTFLSHLKVDVYLVKVLRLCLQKYCEDVGIDTQGCLDGCVDDLNINGSGDSTSTSTPSLPVDAQQEIDDQIADGMHSFSFGTDSKWSGEDSTSFWASSSDEGTTTSFKKQKTAHYASHINNSQPGFQEQQNLHRLHHLNKGDAVSEVSADSWDYISHAEQQELQANQGGNEMNNSVTQPIFRVLKRSFSQASESDNNGAASSSAIGQTGHRGNSQSNSPVEESDEEDQPDGEDQLNRSMTDEEFRRAFSNWT